MYCGKCGKPIEDYSKNCPYCGQPVKNGMGGGVGGQYGVGPMQKIGIDNIFSALLYEKTPNVILEFSMWCTACLVALLAMIAAILGRGNVTWVMLMIFSIGMGVLLAFRLKTIAMLYASILFEFVVSLIHFICFSKAEYNPSVSGLNISLFVLGLLVAVGVIVCSSIHFFTRYHLGSVCTILVLTVTFLWILLHFCMYVIPCLGYRTILVNDVVRTLLNEDAYWLGTISLWMMYGINAMFYVLIFWGKMDAGKSKILSLLGGTGNTAPAIRCVKGAYPGQMFYLQGKTFLIGSQPGMNLVLTDPYVSHKHCAIRFNSGTGFYEIYDNSSNGVYLSGGHSLQKGCYHSVKRGTVICIGSEAQQFQLM